MLKTRQTATGVQEILKNFWHEKLSDSLVVKQQQKNQKLKHTQEKRKLPENPRITQDQEKVCQGQDRDRGSN